MATNLQSQSRPALLNVSELAAFLNIKPRTIYEMVAQNRIPYRKPPAQTSCALIWMKSSHGPRPEITNDDTSSRCYYAAILLGGCNLKENECRSLKVKNKNGTISYGYYFRDRVTKQRYRKIVPLARTKWDAEQAEIKAKQEIFDKRHGLEEKGKDLLSSFLDDVYLPWSKANKKSWRDDAYMLPMLKEYFEGKALREISAQSVEKFKNDRMNTPTKKGTARQPATVNRELTLLSSAYSLAVKYDKAESNPCSKVDLFTLDNLRY